MKPLLKQKGLHHDSMLSSLSHSIDVKRIVSSVSIILATLSIRRKVMNNTNATECTEEEKQLLELLRKEGILIKGKIKRWKLFSKNERHYIHRALDKTRPHIGNTVILLDEIETINFEGEGGLWPKR